MEGEGGLPDTMDQSTHETGRRAEMTGGYCTTRNDYRNCVGGLLLSPSDCLGG